MEREYGVYNKPEVPCISRARNVLQRVNVYWCMFNPCLFIVNMRPHFMLHVCNGGII